MAHIEKELLQIINVFNYTDYTLITSRDLDV